MLNIKVENDMNTQVKKHKRLIDMSIMNYTALLVIEIKTKNPKDHRQEKEMQKAKWLSEEALQIAEKRRQANAKGESKAIPI